MEYQINITGTAAEMAKVFALLAQGNVEAVSAFEAQPGTKPAVDVGAALEAAKQAHSAPNATKEAYSAPKATAESQPAQTPDPAQMVALNLETGEFEFPPQDEPPFPTEPEVTVADLQAVGRKLAVAGKGAVVQRVLAQYGVKLISRIPADKRAEALAALQKEV